MEGCRLKRNVKAISGLMNRMGKTILLTSNGSFGREELLSLYRRKEAIEKMFDVMKNELDGARLRVNSRGALEWRIFLI